jgi:hypothetical protein
MRRLASAVVRQEEIFGSGGGRRALMKTNSLYQLLEPRGDIQNHKDQELNAAAMVTPVKSYYV